MANISRRTIRGLRALKEGGRWGAVHHSTRQALVDNGWVTHLVDPELTPSGADVLSAYDLGAGNRR